MSRDHFISMFFIMLLLLQHADAQTPHDADLNGDWIISQEEMMNVIEMWKAEAYTQDASGNYIPGKTPGEGGHSVSTFKVPLVGLPTGAKPLEMVLIKAGTFRMGVTGNKMRGFDWVPHQVTLTKDFYLGRYEVTQAQWSAVMGSLPDTSCGAGPDYPVYYISWKDCQTFISKLNHRGQGRFRLPTEAEWEYACRAGTTTRYFFGEAAECVDSGGSEEAYCEVMDKYLWWSGNNTHNGNWAGTKEVGLKLPNPWGLFDIHGNVWEWCSDGWEDPFDQGTQIDPQGRQPGKYKVIRGGGWYDCTSYCRSTLRINTYPSQKEDYLGMRLAWTP